MSPTGSPKPGRTAEQIDEKGSCKSMLEINARTSLINLFTKRQLITDPAELLVFERDAAPDRGTPDALVFAHSAEDVVRLAQWSTEYNVPLISRGAGTGLSGGAVAEQGGVILGFSRMNRIVEIDPDGRSATVEPGVVNLTLDEAVKRLWPLLSSRSSQWA